MEDQIREVIKESVRDFRLPRPEEIPDVGLYLDQVTKYISDRLTAWKYYNHQFYGQQLRQTEAGTQPCQKAV